MQQGLERRARVQQWMRFALGIPVLSGVVQVLDLRSILALRLPLLQPQSNVRRLCNDAVDVH
jgi:hypothetical protein